MKKCDGCGMEFDDKVELYPRLVADKAAQTAKTLKGAAANEKLCIACFIRSLEGIDAATIGTILISLIGQVQDLQKRLSPLRDVLIDKEGKQWPPYTIEKIWTSDKVPPLRGNTIATGDNPDNYPIVTY
jgi:hypothetical protein